jgi:hypothetical protein
MAAVALAALLTVGPGCNAQAKPDDEKTLRALEQQFRTAKLNNDTAALATVPVTVTAGSLSSG